MKKTILALTITLTSTAAFAGTGHIGDQSGNSNTIGSVQVGDVENVMGNICNQSGKDNSCSVSIDNINGDVYVDGDKITIGGSSYDDTELKARVDKLETGKASIITGNWSDSTDTVTNQGGGTNWQGINDKGEFYSENYIGDELKSSFAVDLVTEAELDIVKVDIEKSQSDANKALKTEFSGGVVTLPDGYRAVAIDNGKSTQGIVRIDKLDEDGKVISQSYHTVNSQTVFKNPKGEGKYGTATVNGVNKGNLAENVHKVESLNQGKVLNDANSYTDTKVQDEAEIREDADDRLSKAIAANHTYTQEEVGRLDEYNTQQDVRMTKAEQELYSTTARSISNEKRLSAVEGRVSNIESDIIGMKKGMAAITAMSNLVEPKYAGDTTVSVGVGYAQSETAIALGLTHNFSGNVAGKVAVGSDTQFDEVVASGSIGWSF